MRHPTTAATGYGSEEARGGFAFSRIIGHRGVAARAPENTLVGFRRAKALNCRWVEFDVRLTADSQPILLHDNRLERTTDGRGKASELPLAAVRRYEAGAWFDPSFAGERVPTLREAVTLLAELGLGANVELKAARRREAETGTVVGDLLTQLCSSEQPELLISSFQPKALAAAKARAPRIARGILFRAIPKNWRAVAEKFDCATIHADHRRLRPDLVGNICAAGYPVLAYTVNDPARALTLFGWGVTSVFSDDPERLDCAMVSGGSTQLVAGDVNSAGASSLGAAS